MVEAAEKRKDGNLARKVLVALPHELGQGGRPAELPRQHSPDYSADSGRPVTEKSQLEWKGAKLKEAGLPSGVTMVHELRESWEAIQNENLSSHAPEGLPLSSMQQGYFQSVIPITASPRREQDHLFYA